MEHGALVCSFCGAPYRKVIPADVVQVQCGYCGGTIMVPSNAPHCPNHPNVLALNLCNDCGNRYCQGCLSVYVLQGEQERGVLNLCQNCLKQRYFKKAENVILGGAVSLIIGFLVLLAEPILGILWISLFATPLTIYGLYKLRSYGKTAGVYEASKAAAEKSQRTPREIYQDMLVEYTKSFGATHGSIMLENKLESYMNTGLSREEAVRKLAKDEGYT